MIARRRGDTHSHSRWRPASRVIPRPADSEEPLLEDETRPVARPASAAHYTAPIARSRSLIAALIGVAAIAGTQQQTGHEPSVPLPASPQQWVDQWTAASLENPARVCQHLFAPALAAAFKTDTGRSCARYYALVNTTSFRIRHVLKDGATATVEARQVGARPKWGYFTIVLSHVRGGWQAVDMVPGGSVRPR